MGVTRIQHNLSAMNAMSNYQGNSGALTNNLEKLSSGYRINSAADDAAGLAISEKMRSQIAGLEKAQDNANDGISLVQTAEGALTEVNSMLTRLKTLATQSANGTYEDGVDRTNIQEETDALLSEIDRISQSTNFNGISLLDGSLDGKSQVNNIAVDETKTTKGKYTAAATLTLGTSANVDMTSKLTKEDIGKAVDFTVTWQNSSGEEKTTTVSLTFMGDGDGEVITATTGSKTKKDNYFMDDVGNKYNLDADGKITAQNVKDAMEKGLKSNAEFSAEFETTTSSDGKLVFQAKKEGSAGSKVISTAVTESFAEDTIKANDFGGAGNATVTSVAYDSMQRFDATKVKVVTKNSDASQIKDATFEIDGHKFLAVSSKAGATSFTAAQRASMGDDVTLIDVNNDTIASTDVANIKNIAAEITRVTGMEAKAVTSDGSDATIKMDETTNGPDLKQGSIVFTKDKLKLDGNELSLQIGDTNKDYQKVSVKIQDMSSKGLGLTGLDLSNQEAAGKSVETIQDAINKVSTQRGQLGALQNRLDHTLNSLDATTQNITAAESQIRDVDMAKEMTQYSKNNILVQAAQSMLAQANSLPQGVLSLLQ